MFVYYALLLFSMSLAFLPANTSRNTSFLSSSDSIVNLMSLKMLLIILCVPSINECLTITKVLSTYLVQMLAEFLLVESFPAFVLRFQREIRINASGFL